MYIKNVSNKRPLPQDVLAKIISIKINLPSSQKIISKINIYIYIVQLKKCCLPKASSAKSRQSESSLKLPLFIISVYKIATHQNDK